ncbi:MAG: recombinase zinc beta ribbon domain-containing protein [Bacteroidaceae bacterium]|nr:recombinase zinc beta ribbon domain-containing protein [Bacteroidaceae bacterium]
MGEIYIPAYDGFEERYITGQHDAIIDEQTFNCVQDILKGKRKGQPKLTKTSAPELYLRKFLVCPVCGHILTGAFSKGNGGRYPYYFCNHNHKHINIRAERVNEGFIKYISSLEPSKDVLALYNEILDDVRSDNKKEGERKIIKLESELEKLKQRANRVRDLFYDGQIAKEEKEDTIQRITKEMVSLENQIEEQRLINNPSIKKMIDYSINLIANMGKFFEQAPMEVRIKLLGSIFPEKIEFDGENYRTNSYNKMLEYIYQNSKQLQGKRKESDLKNHSQSHLGCPVGLEPTTFRTTI